MNTAAYRNLARELESHLEWQKAAEAWQAAIDNYPRSRPGLSDLDIAKMTERRNACIAAS